MQRHIQAQLFNSSFFSPFGTHEWAVLCWEYILVLFLHAQACRAFEPGGLWLWGHGCQRKYVQDHRQPAARLDHRRWGMIPPWSFVLEFDRRICHPRSISGLSLRWLKITKSQHLKFSHNRVCTSNWPIKTISEYNTRAVFWTCLVMSSRSPNSKTHF